MPRRERERERDRDRSHFGSSLSPLWEPGCHPGDLVGGLRPPAATFGLQRPFREVLLKSALKLALGREAANSCCKPPGLPIGWTRPSSLASAPGALQRGGPRPQQRRRGRNHPAQPAHPALRGPAEQEAPRVPRRPAELRPEHPAPLPLLHPFKGNSEVETQERTPTATVSRHPPSRTGATPKRTPRPRSSSSSSSSSPTSPKTRPRPSASSSGAPRTPPPKQTCDGHATKGQRDPETDEALNDTLNWEAPSPQLERPPNRRGTLRGTDPIQAGAARASGVFAAVEETQRDNQAAQQHSKTGTPSTRSSSGWEGTGKANRDRESQRERKSKKERLKERSTR